MRNVLLTLSTIVLTAAAVGQQASPAPAAAPKPAASASSAAAPSASAANTPAPPEHPLTTAQAHELMELTGTSKLKEELADNMTRYFARSFPPYVPQDVKDDLKSSIAKMDVETPVLAVYKKYISTEDATKAIEFYKTPAGRHLAETAPVLNAEVQKAATQVGQQTAKDAIDRHRAEIEEAQKKYQEEHAPKPASGQPPTMGAAPAKPAPPAPKP